MNEDISRKLPFSLVAEQSLLGSILIDPNSMNEIADTINASDFYLEEHTQIYLAMQSLFLESSDIDVVTLIDMLVKKGVYDKSGGEQYVRLLAEVVPSALNIKDYARIVKDKSTLRRLINVCSEVSDTAYSEQDEVTNILSHAESEIMAISRGRDTKNFVHIKEALLGVYNHLHLLATDKDAVSGTRTGFSGLDNVLVGMGKGDLILVGARPGMGKTSFALNIATNVAKATKKTVCVFSLEMSCEQLVTRMLSSEAMIDSHSLRSGELSEDEWEKLAHASSDLSDCEILIDDTSGISATGMRAKLGRVDNLGLVIIDYLQLMQSDKKTDNRVAEVGDISRNLKMLAKDFGVPVICCAQLSRGPESRTDKKPMLSDLRESGSIEQDADVVLFLYRDEYYKTDEASDQEVSIAEVIIAKNRHGSTGKINMGWIGKYTQFRTVAKDMDEQK